MGEVMKIMIEVSGGVVTNITATDEVSIYLIDHDNLEAGDNAFEKREAIQPDCIYWDEVDFDEALEQVLGEYEGEEGYLINGEVRDHA
jgi:hypothetical protein